MLSNPLAHLALIWATVLLANWLAHHTRLTPVLWYLFIGAVMVNMGLFPHEPLPFIETFAELGIIVIMFALGFEESTENFIRSIKRTWGIALFGALAPFFAAWSLAMWYWGDYDIALMCGLAMTATAVSLTMVSLRSENLHRSPAATGIMTSAVLDDIASLALVAILVPVALGSGPASFPEVAWIVAKVIIFFVLVVAAAAWVFPHEISSGLVRRIPGLRHYGIRHLLQMGEGTQATLVMLLVALALGLLGLVFGFHPAVGAYMAGLVLREEYFHAPGHPSRMQYERTKHIIDDMAFTWIGPVFFVTLGTHLVFEWSLFASIIHLGVILFVSLFFAQIISASLAARFTGHFGWGDSVMIGFGMLGRAELAFVVMGIAYVEHSILSEEAFYVLMLAAAMLNVAVPLTIRWWKPYFTHEKPMPRWMRSDAES